MYNLRLVNYFDVIGNKKEGFEVNNLCVEMEDLYLENIDNKNILQLLKTINFLKQNVRMNQIVIDNDYKFMIEVFQKKDLYPLCRLEIIREV